MSLETALAELSKESKKIKELNYGGCGVFAALVAHRLKKLGVSTRVLVAVDKYDAETRPAAIKEARKNNARTLDEWHRNKVYFGHVLLEVKTKEKRIHFDSLGVKPTSKYAHVGHWRGTIHKHSLRLDEAVMIARGKDWNISFDRKQIPSLIKIIAKTLTKEKVNAHA